jgi:RNA polymerase sigma-70 factor, ECF subfamily
MLTRDNFKEMLLSQKGESAPKLDDHLVEIFRELSVPLFWYLIRIGLCPEEAEDIVQEVFLRLCQRPREREEQGQMRRWIFCVAHNLAIDQHRQRSRSAFKSRQEWVELSARLQDRTSNPEERLLEKERIAVFDRSLGRLTSRQAQCLDLRMEGLSYREIGDRLGVTVSTVAESLKLAIRKLQRESGPSHPLPEIQKGTVVKLPRVESTGRQPAMPTLVLALSKNCHFCQESVGFYQKLAAFKNSSPQGLRLVAVLPQSKEEAESYLKEQKIEVDEVVSLEITKLGVLGTPTLLLLDGQNKLEELWVGKLNDSQESEVIERLKKTSPRLTIQSSR